MTTENGAFYSSLDADSNNEEGKLEEGAFYVWQKEALKTLLKEDYSLFSDYYNINNYGLWEHDNYVLIRKESDDEILKKYVVHFFKILKSLYILNIYDNLAFNSLTKIYKNISLYLCPLRRCRNGRRPLILILYWDNLLSNF